MKKIIILLHFIVLNATIFAQNDLDKKAKSHVDVMFAANASIPFPAMKKAIQNNMGDAGFGLSLLAAGNPFSWGKSESEKKASPVRIGAEIGYTYYGRFITEVNVNNYYGDYKTSYGIAKLNAVVRLRPLYSGGFSPFADVYAGGNFYLSTIKENLDIIESALGLPSFAFNGTTSASFVKGVAVGFSAGSVDANKARFVCRISYTDGSAIRYIVRNSLKYDAAINRLSYQEGRAPLRFLMIEVGIGI